jgi:hypothetical protein
MKDMRDPSLTNKHAGLLPQLHTQVVVKVV